MARTRKVGRPAEIHLNNFLNKIKKHTGCWLWNGAKNKKGYGWAWFQGKLWKAHRLSYTLQHGKIPDGLLIMHQCNNPPCVNPYHLIPGTAFENHWARSCPRHALVLARS